MLPVNSSTSVGSVLAVDGELVALVDELVREEGLTVGEAVRRACAELPALVAFAGEWDARARVLPVDAR